MRWKMERREIGRRKEEGGGKKREGRGEWEIKKKGMRGKGKGKE